MIDLNNILFGLENRIQIIYKFLSMLVSTEKNNKTNYTNKYKESEIYDKCLYLHTMILYKILL